MRILLLLVVAMLAGCAGETDEEPAETRPSDEATLQTTGADSGVENGTAGPLGTLECPLSAPPVTGPVGVDGVTSAGCNLHDLDIPEGANSARFTLTWSATWTYENMGLHFRQTDACTQTSSSRCAVAEGWGTSPVTMDVTQDDLQGYDWNAFDVPVRGDSLQPDLELEITFYADAVPA